MATLRLIISSIVILAFFTCCQNNKKKLTVLFNRVDNVKTGDYVYLKGLSIGKVTQLELFGDSVLVDIKLDGTIKIPVDSKFVIQPSLIGSSSITIEPSDKTVFLTYKDTTRGTYLEKRLLDNMISDSTKRAKIQQSLDKIGQGIKELVEASKDTLQKNK